MSGADRETDLLLRWRELCDQGSSVSAEVLCTGHPELLERVRARIQKLKRLDAFRGGTVAPSVEPPEVKGYEILGVLGRGGMGVVYRARHLALGRVVALKVILAGAHAGPEERRRFRREVEAVARLQHPHIVQIHDVGEQDGRAYCALEYVDGGSLAQQIAGTPQPARAASELVETLARAVHHAHQRGILHRDLKPANVLLDSERQPKVSDFGLAKQLDRKEQTRSGAVLGTPSYMAPEQAGGPRQAPNRATDVYALGAILYELLTGRPPHRGATPLDTLEQVRTREPAPPSSLQPKVPRDLETICLKCLEKEASKRYATAESLAEDLRRFLDARPILARPISPAGKLWRWCRRRPLVAGLTATAAVLLLAGTGVSSYFAIEANHRAEAERLAKQVAEQRLAQLDKGNEILTSVFRNLDPKTEEKEGKSLRVLLGERLDEAVRQLDGEAVGDPLAVARMQMALGASLVELGHLEQAQVVLEKSRHTFETTLGLEHLDTLTSINNLAALYQALDRYDQAELLFRQVMDTGGTSLGPDHPIMLDSMNSLAVLYRIHGRYDEAERLYKKVLAAGRAKFGPDHLNTIDAMNNLAVLYEASDRYDEAEPLFRQVLEARRTKLGADHPRTLNVLNNLAALYNLRGRADDAEPLYRKVFDGYYSKLGPNHPKTLTSMNNLAVLYHDRGRHEEAERLHKKVLETRRTKLGPDHPDTLRSMSNLAGLYESCGRYDEAELLYKQALEIRRSKCGPNGLETLDSLHRLAVLCIERGRYNEAEPLLRENLAIREKTSPEEWRTFGTKSLLGKALLGQQKYAEAELLLTQGYLGMSQRAAKIPAMDKIVLTKSLERLVQLYDTWGKSDEAAKWRTELEAAKAASAATK